MPLWHTIPFLDYSIPACSLLVDTTGFTPLDFNRQVYPIWPLAIPLSFSTTLLLSLPDFAFHPLLINAFAAVFPHSLLPNSERQSSGLPPAIATATSPTPHPLPFFLPSFLPAVPAFPQTHRSHLSLIPLLPLLLHVPQQAQVSFINNTQTAFSFIAFCNFTNLPTVQ